MNRQLPPDLEDKIAEARDITPLIMKLLLWGCGIVLMGMILWAWRGM